MTYNIDILTTLAYIAKNADITNVCPAIRKNDGCGNIECKHCPFDSHVSIAALAELIDKAMPILSAVELVEGKTNDSTS